MKLQLNGIGAAIPRRKVTNEAFAMLTGFSAEWIEQRCGVTHRYLSGSEQAARELAAAAGRQALADAKVDPESVSVVVVASSCYETHAPVFRANAVCRQLELPLAHGVDISTPKEGFLDGLAVAEGLLGLRPGSVALVIGAEAFSVAQGLRDRRKCYMYSEGAGAVVVSHDPGFAELEQVVFVTSGAGDRTMRPAASANPFETRTPLMLPDALQKRLLAQVLSASVSEVPRTEGAHVLVCQTLAERISGQGSAGHDAVVFNPYSECGHFLNASLPILLYRLCGEERDLTRDEIDLIAAGGPDAFASCRVRFTRAHRPVPIAYTEKAPSGESPKERIVHCPAAGELRERIAEAAQSADTAWGSLVAMALHVDLKDPEPEQIHALILRESSAILAGNLRQHDLLLQLGERPAYLILLRYLTMSDAERLQARITALLENVDPAGEFDVSVTSRLAEISDPGRIAEQSVDLLDFLA